MTDSLSLYFSILGPALLAAMLVLITHVPLGHEVLRRGIIFLDLAIAQIAAFGLVLAQLVSGYWHVDLSRSSQQLIAIIAAVSGALILRRLETSEARIQEAVIGVMFMLAATGSVLLLSADPHGGEQLKQLLVGQILWTRPADLLPVALIYVVVLFLWFGMKERLGNWIFYPLFAVTITLSTQLVGVYLVFASLILPALATRNTQRAFVPSMLIGMTGYVAGLVFSAASDLPSGPMIAWCMAITAGLFWFLTTRAKSFTGPSEERQHD